MRYILACIGLILAMSMIVSAWPIETQPLPGKQPLRGATWGSARNIEAANEPLGMYRPWEVANIGHYASWTQEVDQNAEAPAGVPIQILNFSTIIPPLPASIGNATNATLIGGKSGLIYL